ncbi:MAG TPA: protein-(glutamine-N5) methyltransferase, release factor-specific [Rhodopirellula baltica]|uniref:Release factor glutamine methyltransferase n=1 Tax=Rhodopirellula baltica (strain DSM 10527 / NCIMB 13988 / SH1) TaxID=243090 RepID=PRMC_RHOBA|nr:peptide chain release factor N(5)-glutamine methyltransferase [Rhodopirellula baltica]Q7ULT2.1 RecName: Full=Release factor glutamine methyltransferase; Short=RF MTase; AltName: Full=N5-glutamine methyltransferase PrmC; AltName: Full=Protein-(glutamine-N5) MTase PrmC; AltName: Full=Protein-glutamine N-methyltransferase PrmC [Rhodopirellula baltica SH 1]CAD76187.1 hemK protein [Rhodopirellula baltica SH 1]HBE64540.1 protein-(glutamine-N5) methyltransferase, release factor-specific [Rhodopirell
MAETSNDTPWTVMRLLEWTTDFFRKKGSESPRLDAEILLAHARGCQRIELYTSFDKVPEEEQRVAFRELVRRRGEGAPVAQLVGYREFYSISIRVDENVLVPRPETEHLVIEAIDQIKGRLSDRPSPTVLDIGTGSGAIAVAIAKSLPKTQVTAVDISLTALDIAKWNVENLKLSDRVTLLQSDLFDGLEPDQTFDVICSNPPYISQSEYDELPTTVREFEPRGALLSGPDGTEIIARLLNDSVQRLNDGGQLIIELSPMIAGVSKTLAEQNGGYKEIHLIKDLAGHERILSMQKA